MKKEKDNIQKNSVQTYIQFFLDNVELNISVKDDLSCQDSKLKNFGYISVNDDCFWDNLDYFISADKKEFKEECKTELQEKGFKDWKKIYKTIKTLLKRAKKLNLITE